MLRLGRMIKRLLGKVHQQERGMAMVMALIVLVMGALIVVPTLNYMTTGVQSTVIHERRTGELYAADAVQRRLPGR